MAETPQIDEPTASRLVSLGDSLKTVAEPGHQHDRNREFERHRDQADAAELEHVAEQEAHAEQHDAELEEEFVSGDAGLEDLRHADGVGDDQTDDDRPQHVFDIRQREVVGLAVDRDRVLDHLAGVANGQQQSDAGQQLDKTLRH